MDALTELPRKSSDEEIDLLFMSEEEAMEHYEMKIAKERPSP